MDYRCLLTRWLRNRNARWRMAGRLANLFHIWASDARQPTLALFENSAETRKGVFCLEKSSFQSTISRRFNLSFGASSPIPMLIPSFSFFQQKQDPIGKKGEQIAAAYLKKKGFKVLEMNYKNPKGKQLGEIDIVTRKGKDIVFVEVKTRKGKTGEVFPEDNLTPGKLKKLEKIAAHYLQTHRERDTPYHFDAVTVLFENHNTAAIRHFEHIFT